MVYPGVAMLEGRVSEEEVQEVKVAVDVSDGELMIFWWSCEWEEKTVGRRQRGGVSYSLPEWTSCVSTPARLSRSLLQLSTLSIGSRTCGPSGSCSSVRSSQSHTLLLLLLNRAAELGSSIRGPRFLNRA